MWNLQEKVLSQLQDIVNLILRVHLQVLLLAKGRWAYLQREMPPLQKSYQSHETLCLQQKNLLRMLLLPAQKTRKKHQIRLSKSCLLTLLAKFDSINFQFYFIIFNDIKIFRCFSLLYIFGLCCVWPMKVGEVQLSGNDVRKLKWPSGLRR